MLLSAANGTSTVYLSHAAAGVAFVVHVALPSELARMFGAKLTLLGGSASELVSSLKSKVEALTGALATTQVLSFDGTRMASDASSIRSYDVVSGSTLGLALSLSPPFVTAVVHAALPPSLHPSFGSLLTFGLAPSSDTVSAIKLKIQTLTALNPAEQSLSFAGVSMHSAGASLLSSFGVVDGSTVHLSIAAAGATFFVHVALPSELASTFGAKLTFSNGTFNVTNETTCEAWVALAQQTPVSMSNAAARAHTAATFPEVCGACNPDPPQAPPPAPPAAPPSPPPPPLACRLLYGMGDCSEFNNCSGRGQCDNGRCVCPPSFIDANCSIEVNCQYWDEATSEWSTKGVQSVLSEDGSRVLCKSSHLTDFGGVISIPTSVEELMAELASAFTFNTFSADEAFALLSNFDVAGNPTIFSTLMVSSSNLS